MNKQEQKELEKLFSTILNFGINEEIKQKSQTNSDIEKFANITGGIRDALLKKGFSKEFAETLLLEIIKKSL